MKRRDIQSTGQRVDRSFVTTQRLMRENARLSATCAQYERLATRNELLRREADHRIKNSLQVLASILELQARHDTNAAAQDALTAAAARLRAVSQLHDAIQLENDRAAIDLGALIGEMCSSMRALTGEIRLVVNTAPILAPIEFAQSFMLAANELVLNALRHAFPKGRKGVILVDVISARGEVRATFADDGVGFPPEDFHASGYGTKLVHAMMASIGGRLERECAGGARVTLIARLPVVDQSVARLSARAGALPAPGIDAEAAPEGATAVFASEQSH